MGCVLTIIGLVFIVICGVVSYSLWKNDVISGIVTAACVFVLVAGWILRWILHNRNENKQRELLPKVTSEDTRQAVERERIRKNEQYRAWMIDRSNNALNLFVSTPIYLQNADQWLNKAEIDFTENAFAPFWDCIEEATKALGHYNENIQKIEKQSYEFTILVNNYEGNPPEFSLSPRSIEKLKIGNMVAEHLHSLVRKAQRNFQFSMIFEQRKTNQILVAGFTNLAQALDQMLQSITTAVNSLNTSIDNMSTSLSNSMLRIELRLDDISEETRAYREEQASREEKAIEMLDNIQRGRKTGLL